MDRHFILGSLIPTLGQSGLEQLNPPFLHNSLCLCVGGGGGLLLTTLRSHLLNQ
jgi:hypothetical protein